TSPSDFGVSSIVRGQALYAANCVACHGQSGRGDGVAAAAARIRPADLTATHLWFHPDGELFWWLTHGIDDPEGGLAMPGVPALPPDDRWALIDFIRAHSAGIARAAGAPPPIALMAPEMPIHCDGVPATTMRDLLGRLVLVGASPLDVAPPPATGASPIVLDLQADADAPPRGGCMAATPDALPAYAILADTTPAALSG